MILSHLMKWIKGEHSFSDIVDYFRGNLRYWIYYKPFLKKLLIRTHIREQIELRLRMMDSECYSQGSCKICGCKTTALQMANKPCDKPCYPAIMNRKEWERFLDTEQVVPYHLSEKPLYAGVYTDKKRNQVWLNLNDIDAPLENLKYIYLNKKKK